MSSKFKTKRAGIEIDTNLQEFYTGFLDTVAPNARKVLEDTLKKIEEDAIKEWPVRRPEIKRDRDGNILSSKKTSKGSWKMFERGFRILPGGGFEGFLKNHAPYSWYIKFGISSVNKQRKHILQPTGRRAAHILLIAPQRKQAKKVTQALADDLMRRL
jgi:hypothetical protein